MIRFSRLLSLASRCGVGLVCVRVHLVRVGHSLCHAKLALCEHACCPRYALIIEDYPHSHISSRVSHPLIFPLSPSQSHNFIVLALHRLSNPSVIPLNLIIPL
jgi:hypothetical protein